MDAGLTPKRLSAKAGRATELVGLVSDGPLVQPHAGVGDQEARVLHARAELVTETGIGVQRRDGGRVRATSRERPSCRGARQPLLGQLDVGTVKRDRLADPHAGHRQQPDQRLIGGGLQWRADPARRAHQRLDLGF